MKKMNLLYKYCKQIELSKKDIDYIIKDNGALIEQPYLSAGPNNYCSSWYGTTSIKDFK